MFLAASSDYNDAEVFAKLNGLCYYLSKTLLFGIPSKLAVVEFAIWSKVLWLNSLSFLENAL